MSQAVTEYEVVIRRSRGWFNVNLADLWRFRDLLLLLVHREFVAKYKQTILGPAWFILQPLLMTVVFTIVFGGIAGIPTDGAPPVLFYLTGLLGWNYFAQTFQTTSLTLTNNATLFGKAYFPRLVVPLSAVFTNLLAFVLQLGLVAAVWTYFKFFTASGSALTLSWQLLWLPLIVLHLAALSLGAGLWLSALTTRYRDFTFLVPFLVQIWMYATPVIYPLSRIPHRWQWVAMINPVTMPVEASKIAILGAGIVTPEYAEISIGITIALLLTGVLLFNRVERTFADLA
jgi:lipopolysaccharide transport system permease protein